MKKNGFALTELIIVVSIISILTAMIIPAWEKHVETNMPIVENINTPINSIRTPTVRNEQ